MLAALIVVIALNQATNPSLDTLPFGDPRAPKPQGSAADVSKTVKADLRHFAQDLIKEAKSHHSPDPQIQKYADQEIQGSLSAIGKGPTLDYLEGVDPVRALQVILQRTINRDSKLLDFVRSMATSAPRTCELAIAAIEDQSTKEEAQMELCDKLWRDNPARVVATATLFKVTEHRVRALAHAIHAYAISNPAIANKLADQAAQEFPISDRGILALRESLYEICWADTPRVRELLSNLEPIARKEDADALPMNSGPKLSDISSRMMYLAGAWAQIDLKHADDLIAETLKLDSGAKIESTDIGIWVDEGYQSYLIGLAKRDGTAAGKTLVELLSGTRSFDGSSILDLATDKIEEELWRDFPDQTRAFDAATNAKFGATVDQRIALEKIIKDPKRNYNLVESLGMGGPFGADKYSMQGWVCAALGEQGEIDLALKYVSTKDLRMRSDLLIQLAEGIGMAHPENSLAIYRKAADTIRKEKDAKYMGWNLAQVASSAIQLSER